MKSKLILGILMLAALTACGKKPSFVEAPEGQESPFPRIYPQSPVPPGAEPEDLAGEAEYGAGEEESDYQE